MVLGYHTTSWWSQKIAWLMLVAIDVGYYCQSMRQDTATNINSKHGPPMGVFPSSHGGSCLVKMNVARNLNIETQRPCQAASIFAHWTCFIKGNVVKECLKIPTPSSHVQFEIDLHQPDSHFLAGSTSFDVGISHPDCGLSQIAPPCFIKKRYCKIP